MPTQLKEKINYSRKEAAIALASKISGAANDALEEVLQEVCKFEISNSTALLKEPPVQNKGPLGVWTLNDSKKVYELDRNFRNHWFLWAKRHQIPAKKLQPYRIVFLGESAARGFLYDPFYTPAMVLEETINSSSTNTLVEVVDLAKTDMGFYELMDLANESLALEPDIVVVFAGNNFLADLYIKLQKSEGKHVVDSFAEDGFAGVLRTLEDELKEYTAKFIQYFTQLSEDNNFKIVFVIPEYNLADWHITPAGKPLPNLQEGQIQKWIKTREQLLQMMQTENWSIAQNLAASLISLDPSHPTGYELLAQIKLRQNDFSEARKNLELARDTSILCRSKGYPRMFSAVRNTILDKVKISEKVQIVDLQEIFKKYVKSGIPGRHLFLDYCHLTADGIRISMGYTAHLILSQFMNAAVSLEEIVKLSSRTNPPDEAISKAHFFAAIHNAHADQPYDVVLHHCAKSLKASSKAIDFMRLYLDLAARKTPNGLCKSLEEILLLDDAQQYPRGFLHPIDGKLLDLKLNKAMLQALREEGIAEEPKIEYLRNEEHSVRYENINLLQSFYNQTTYDKKLGKQAPYYQACNLISVFYLVASCGLSVEFQITYKSPNVSGDEEITIEVNNNLVTTLEIKKEWSSATFHVHPQLLVDGINTITIHWPVGQHNGRVFSNHGVSDFDDIIDQLNYVTGELFTFDAYVRQ